MKITGRIFSAIIFLGLMLTTAPAQNLAGGWKLVEARRDGRKVSLGGQIRTSLKFGEGNRVGGNAGCNRYSATYTLRRRDGIKFGPAVSTKMACLDDSFMKQESTFFAVLEKVEKYKIKGTYLTLSDAAGKNVLRFARSAE